MCYAIKTERKRRVSWKKMLAARAPAPKAILSGKKTIDLFSIYPYAKSFRHEAKEDVTEDSWRGIHSFATPLPLSSTNINVFFFNIIYAWLSSNHQSSYLITICKRMKNLIDNIFEWKHFFVFNRPLSIINFTTTTTTTTLSTQREENQIIKNKFKK